MAVNVHRALNSTVDEAYLWQLKVPKPREDVLRNARDVLREALKEGFRNWTERFDVNQIVTRDAQSALLAEQVEVEQAIGRPKFRMQGSFSYSTLNEPAKGKTPPLQIDLDDGMFLPARYIHREGTLAPSLAAEGYFKAVEAIVTEVCDAYGWTLKPKNSCVRIEIDPGAHVDIALYAVPEGEFKSIVEAARAQKLFFNDSSGELRDKDFSEFVYAQLSEDRMRLACRDDDGFGTWIPSDPRKLENWFRESVKEHGEQVRFVSRYLKAWRDENDLLGLASIALMWGVTQVFDSQGSEAFKGRDDLALLAVAKELPEILRKEIPNPVVDGARFDQNWTEANRSAYVDAATKLEAHLEAAITKSLDLDETLRLMRSSLGERFPNNRDLLQDDNQAASASLAAPTMLTEQLFASEDERPAVRLGGDERYA